MLKRHAFLLCAPLVAACVDSDVLEPPPAEPLPAPPSDGQKLVTEEGAYGRVRVTTPDGPMLLSYQVVDGHAIHELDMDLGPVTELVRRGGAARLADRWPDGLIRFAFDESLIGNVCAPNMENCVNARDRIRDTLAAMQDKLPLRFVEVSEDTLGGSSCFTNPTPSCDGVVFRYVAGQDAAGSSSHTGMEGGVQYISFRSGHASDDLPWTLFYHLEPSGGTIRHETLHAAGLFHEQSRNDRAEFVDVNWQCIIDGQDNGNYEIKDESADLGPYDYQSIMHYSQSAQCIPDPLAPDDAEGVDKCICETMTPLVAGAEIRSGGSGRAGFSIEDTNTVYRMYAKPLGTNESGDAFGKSFARGDFDRDGYIDLAVGIPGEDLGSATNAGMVSIWKGTPFGLVAWMTLTQASFPGQSIAANAQFGAALTAYDANADGPSELAIGAPGALGGAGAVFVFKGHRAIALAPYRMLTQESEGLDDNASGDRFGAALASGPLTGLVRQDSCGEIERPYDALVVGAPGDGVPLLFGSESKRGSVFIYQETRPSCSESSSMNKPTVLTHNSFSHGGGLTGDDFGAALAVGDIDGDGKADLAIGTPNFNSGAGKVYVYQGRLPTENPFAWSAMATEADEVTASLTTKFGSALAIGDILPFGRQLVVGAPGGNGKVVVFSAAGTMNLSTTMTLVDATPEAGDEFGAAVAIGDVDRASTSEDLVVGVPGEDSDAGAVVVFRGGTLGLPTRATLLQSPLVNGDRDAGDRFGAALAIGGFNGPDNRPSVAHAGLERPDLVVGAPGEKPDLALGVEDPVSAGAFDAFKGGIGLVTAWAHRHQEAAGRASDP